MDETVRLIFKETYLFYKKWKSISNPADWNKLMQDARELNEKYPYPLCRRILLELVVVIQDEFLKKQGGKTDVNTNN